MSSNAEDVVYCDTLTDGIIGPDVRRGGRVADGGRIVFVTSPGCWGPMITPNIRGGHEVAAPVEVEGAEVGDAIAIWVESIRVLSKAASSGVDEPVEGAFTGDPFVAKRCPGCGEEWPDYEVVGTGQEAVRCKKCSSPASPFRMVHGYTLVIEDGFAVSVSRNVAEKIAEKAWEYAALPKSSKQVPVLIFGKADIPGMVSRVRPHLGQLGTIPSVNIPDSHNAGDFGTFLIDAPHRYAITREQYLTSLTDGHLDVDSVREGCIVIAPVKVDGGGVYAGDVHAMQGDGEVAGHTADVSAETTVSVSVLKGLQIEGPILLPPEEDLPPLAKPWRKDEWDAVARIAERNGIEAEPVAPVQIIGSGPTINEAAERGFERAAKLFGMRLEEVLNRVTITGAVEIGRLPGIVQVSMQVPLRILERLGIAELAVEHYRLPY
ncbi:MAG: acetamidase [Archaeoglobi archaeon]|nr:acetamidase [Archaeoglobi archaeon]